MKSLSTKKLIIKIKYWVFGFAILFPSVAQSQIEVKSDGNLYTNQNSRYLRGDYYLAGIGYNNYGSYSSAMTIFSKSGRYLEFVLTDKSYKFGTFYFSPTNARSCYAYFNGKIGFLREQWTGGILSKIDDINNNGYDMPILYPSSNWWGSLGYESRHFGYGFIDHLYL